MRGGGTDGAGPRRGADRRGREGLERKARICKGICGLASHSSFANVLPRRQSVPEVANKERSAALSVEGARAESQ